MPTHRVTQARPRRTALTLLLCSSVHHSLSLTLTVSLAALPRLLVNQLSLQRGHSPQDFSLTQSHCRHGSSPPPAVPPRRHRLVAVAGRRAIHLRHRRSVSHILFLLLYRRRTRPLLILLVLSPHVQQHPHLHLPRRVPLPRRHQAHLPPYHLPAPAHPRPHHLLPAAGIAPLSPVHRAGACDRRPRRHPSRRVLPAGARADDAPSSPGARTRAVDLVPSRPRTRRPPRPGAQQEAGAADEEEARGARVAPARLRVPVHRRRRRPRPGTRPLHRRHDERRGGGRCGGIRRGGGAGAALAGGGPVPGVRSGGAHLSVVHCRCYYVTAVTVAAVERVKERWIRVWCRRAVLRLGAAATYAFAWSRAGDKRNFHTAVFWCCLEHIVLVVPMITIATAAESFSYSQWLHQFCFYFFIATYAKHNYRTQEADWQIANAESLW
uniref:Uncharacterized protein n=1 Tax=Setaria viridis TaxID=4556 RepID=A0A4U6VI09_SETVI|nr:hypothetical protein SEVIR_3G384501v2 [Setaria viridis]